MTVLNCITTGIEIAGSPDKRVWASFGFNASFSLGGILISLIAYLAQDWNWIFIVNGFVSTACLVFTWYVKLKKINILTNKSNENKYFLNGKQKSC